MKFQKIVKRRVGECLKERFVYFIEDGEELKPGLYIVRIPVWANMRWYTTPCEMFICKNQDPGIVHDMYISKQIDILNLGQVYDCGSHKFKIGKFLDEKRALKELCSRIELSSKR